LLAEAPPPRRPSRPLRTPSAGTPACRSVRAGCWTWAFLRWPSRPC